MTPQGNYEPPNYSNYQPDQELLRLRKRVTDLVRLGAATPETYVQTVMQLSQEGERRRQSCMAEAEDHLRKYHALTAQAHGFAALSSMLFAIINGFATLEERRLVEMAEREKEKAENGPPPSPVVVQPDPPKEPAKVQAREGARSSGKTKPSGGKRRKP